MSTLHRWHVTVLRSQDNATAANGFEDIATSLVWALMKLDLPVTYQDNNLRRDAWNVVFGSHLLGPAEMEVLNQMPNNTILYNFEQLPRQLAQFPGYAELLSRHSVWDYSVENVRWLKSIGVEVPVDYVPPGYTPVWERVPYGTERDIDILFIGGVRDRRRKILDNLHLAGLQIATPFPVYGIERDTWVARSQILLNIHQWDTFRHPELLRLSYFWSNRSAVVSEQVDLDVLDSRYLNSAEWVPENGLVDTCRDLLSNSAKCAAMREMAYEMARDNPYIDTVRKVVGKYTRL